MKKTKKLLICLMTIVLAVILATSSAFACTMAYVGSDLTADGSTFFARSEDYSNSYNKIAYVSEHAKHPAGSTYEGCYGFTYTFTHDSYAYTAVRDDNLSGRCPDCYDTHDHTPMEEAGTNEMGVSVSAMVTLKATSTVRKDLPMVSGGMCESDMETILLSEAATAKQGVDLLIDIYDKVGAEERSGVLIGDQNEVWYVENYTGHQYIGVKLSDSMAAISPNMGAIGLVDLDDTENVVASADVITAAQKIGTFVGDADKNIIDFRASYSDLGINARMINGLNYFLGEQKFTDGNTTGDDFTISNVKDGQIVTMYSPIVVNRPISAKDMIDFYKVDSIGNTSNLEWHIFQIKSEGEMDISTIEWLGMDHGAYSVAIPYFPVLTPELYEGYMVGGIGGVQFVTELPEGATGFYPTTKKGEEGFNVYPEGWENGVYWANDALSNYAESKACSAEDNALIKSCLAEMQQKCYDKAAEMEAKIAAMSVEDAKVYATAESKALAKEAHELAVALYKHVAFGEHKVELVNYKAPTFFREGYTGDEVCAICGEVLKTGEAIRSNGPIAIMSSPITIHVSNSGFLGLPIITVTGLREMIYDILSNLFFWL